MKPGWEGTLSLKSLKAYRSEINVSAPHQWGTAVSHSHLSDPLFLTSLNMVRFVTVSASALSLLSFTHAVTIDTREHCTKYECPKTLLDGTSKLRSLGDGDFELFGCYSDIDSVKYYCFYASVGHISLSYFKSWLTLRLRLTES